MWDMRNNPAVNLATRRWLGAQAREGELLDRPCWNTIQKAIDKCKPNNPGGMVHDLALELGAASEAALVAGSIAEMFYAVCSFTDDIQDGDADAYLPGVPLSLQLNAQSQLLCIIAVRVRELGPLIGDRAADDIALDLYRTGAAMLTGQHLEITREPWNAGSYERVARLSAGRQFGHYYFVAAATGGADREPWVELGRCLGALMQLIIDRESNDERLLQLPGPDIEQLETTFTGELDRAADRAGPLGRRIADGLLERMTWSR
jgi:hypothetical protein